MTKKIVASPRAQKDIVNCSVWWMNHHTSRPTAFDDELARVTELILLFPDSSPAARGVRYKDARVRVLVETGHLLIYRRRGEFITVLAVLASRAAAQRP